jgi:hypothetical protein
LRAVKELTAQDCEEYRTLSQQLLKLCYERLPRSRRFVPIDIKVTDI